MNTSESQIMSQMPVLAIGVLVHPGERLRSVGATKCWIRRTVCGREIIFRTSLSSFPPLSRL